MTHPEVNQQRAAEIMQHAITDLLDTQQEAIATAAALVAQSLQAGGIIQVSGTGHSKSFAMEVAGRAGGLVPANAIGINDLILYGGEAPESLLAAETERDPTLARRILDLAEIHPADVFLIASSSGGNGSVVELARLVKERGHTLIAITSMDHTSKITSRHPSGQRLFELADVVIDNRAVFGDAALELPGGGAIAATSTVTSVMIAQMLVTEVCGLLLEAGAEVPVYISANVPGGDDHNDALRERYAGRVRFGAP